MSLFLCPASSLKKCLRCWAPARQIQHVLLCWGSPLIRTCFSILWVSRSRQPLSESDQWGKHRKLMEHHPFFGSAFPFKCHGKWLEGLRMPLMMTEEAPWTTPKRGSRCSVNRFISRSYPLAQSHNDVLQDSRLCI